jgi:hypothetical protein
MPSSRQHGHARLADTVVDEDLYSISVLSSDTVVITAVNRPYCTTSCKYRTTEKLQPYKAVL